MNPNIYVISSIEKPLQNIKFKTFLKCTVNKQFYISTYVHVTLKFDMLRGYRKLVTAIKIGTAYKRSEHILYY